MEMQEVSRADFDEIGIVGKILSFGVKKLNGTTRNNILFLLAILAFILHSGHFRTVSSVSKSVCDAVRIVSREGWNARPAWRYYRMKTPVNHVIIQHTETPFCRTHFQCVRWIQSIQDYHMMELSWWDLGYNFMVGGDGRIYEVRGWTRVGAHSINFNYDSIGIGFIGDYRKGHDEPTQEMLNATLMFIACGVEKGYLTPTREIHGHRDVRCTDSPGDNLYKKILRWDNYKGGRIKNYNCRTKNEKDYDI